MPIHRIFARLRLILSRADNAVLLSYESTLIFRYGRIEAVVGTLFALININRL